MVKFPYSAILVLAGKTSEYGAVVPRYPRSDHRRTSSDTMGEKIQRILGHTRTCPNIYLPGIIPILGHRLREYEYREGWRNHEYQVAA
jgi:hypothetical protein